MTTQMHPTLRSKKKAQIVRLVGLCHRQQVHAMNGDTYPGGSEPHRASDKAQNALLWERKANTTAKKIEGIAGDLGYSVIWPSTYPAFEKPDGTFVDDCRNL